MPLNCIRKQEVWKEVFYTTHIVFQSRDSTWASILVPVSCSRRKQGRWLPDSDMSLVLLATLLLGPGFDHILED